MVTSEGLDHGAGNAAQRMETQGFRREGAPVSPEDRAAAVEAVSEGAFTKVKTTLLPRGDAPEDRYQIWVKGGEEEALS